MAQKDTEDIPIKLKYWYIIYFKDFIRINLYPVIFISKKGAKRALRLHIDKVHLHRYQVIKGSKLKTYQLKYQLSLGPLSKFTKYEYPADKLTHQERKTYRTVMRRRLRRMDILTLIKPKLRITEKSKQNRWKKNQQKVAKNKNSQARVIQLERKATKYFYMVLQKTRSESNGILFRIESLRFNSKTQELKHIYLNIKNNDIIKPFLIKDLLNLCNEETTKQRILEICGTSIRVCKGK